MLNQKITAIIDASREQGWVLEPHTKEILSLAGLPVPRFEYIQSENEALAAAGEIGYPLVAKIVSAQVMHKSDAGGVVTGIRGPQELKKAFAHLRTIKGFSGILVEETADGEIELIVGTKIDFQFGPVILLGMGGTGVEIYRDVALRMAPLKASDVESMAKGLKAGRLLSGYRGKAALDFDLLTQMMLSFSDLVMELAPQIESIDLNPVICSAEHCVVADARIVLNRG